jgi:hypothetical protein
MPPVLVALHSPCLRLDLAEPLDRLVETALAWLTRDAPDAG